MLINYNLENIRNVASECETVSNDILSSGSKTNIFGEKIAGYSCIKKMIDGSCEGSVKDLLGFVVEKTEQSVGKNALLVSTTANFVSELANLVEEQDREISKKIGG